MGLGSAIGVGVGPSFSWVEVGPSQGGGWLFFLGVGCPLGWGWPFLLLGCFSWVGVGLRSRGEGWPFSGLKLGLALPSWGRGWPFILGVGVGQLRVGKIII